MSAIITFNQRVANALSFANAFGFGSTGENLYMTIGKDDAWPDDNNPPTPANTLTEIGVVKNAANILAAKKIELSDISPVIQRVTWTTGTAYNAVSLVTPDPYAAGDFYVVNSEGRVYVVKTKGGGNSTVEPTGTGSLVGSMREVGPLADGYTWYYLYEIHPTLSNANTTDWVPVSYGSLIRTGASYYENESAAYLLGARRVMITGRFDATVTYTADDFRQIALIHNPKLVGGALATGSVYNNPASELDLTSGNVVYIDYRRPITRTTSQIEEFRVILQF